MQLLSRIDIGVFATPAFNRAFQIAKDMMHAVIATPQQGAAEVLFEIATILVQQEAGEPGLRFGRMALDLQPDFTLARMLVGIGKWWSTQLTIQQATGEVVLFHEDGLTQTDDWTYQTSVTARDTTRGYDLITIYDDVP